MMLDCPYCGRPMRAKKQRSNPQNSFYWGVCLALLADHTGYNVNDLHEILKNKFLPKMYMEIGEKSYELPKSTTKLSTVEFDSYIEEIRAFAASELNVIIPSPGDTNETRR